MDRENEIAFDVILHAGNGKTAAMNAMDKAENNEIEEAEKLIEEAEKEVNTAHLIHKELLDKIVNGEHIEMNIFVTHALDHMTSAEDMILVAKRFIKLYKTKEK